MANVKLVIEIPEGVKYDFENENWTALSCMEMKEALKKATVFPTVQVISIAKVKQAIEDIEQAYGDYDGYDPDALRDYSDRVYGILDGLIKEVEE